MNEKYEELLASQIAPLVMARDVEILRKMNITSANDLYPRLGASRRVWNRYQQEVKKMLISFGYNRKNKVEIKVQEEFENENFHSLNQVIDFIGFNRKRFGLTKKDFFEKR